VVLYTGLLILLTKRKSPDNFFFPDIITLSLIYVIRQNNNKFNKIEICCYITSGNNDGFRGSQHKGIVASKYWIDYRTKSGKVGLLYKEPTQAVYASIAINKESSYSIEQSRIRVFT
jgi:hypothetical protein